MRWLMFSILYILGWFLFVLFYMADKNRARKLSFGQIVAFSFIWPIWTIAIFVIIILMVFGYFKKKEGEQ